MEPGKIQARQTLTAVAATLLLEWVLHAAGSGWPETRIVFTGAVRLSQCFVIILIAAGSVPAGLSALGLSGKRLTAGVSRGLVWSGAFGALCLVSGLILHFAGIDPFDLVRMRLHLPAGEILRLFAVGAVISPIAEEIFFRGLLYGFFRRWGAPVAIVVSTVLFAAAHLPSTSFPLIQMVGGLLFAAAYEREKSLAAPMTIHILGNAAIFSLSFWF